MQDLVTRIIIFEEGALGDEETLKLFAELIETGQVWTLQGFYGRTAADLIEGGLITPDGEITDAARELLDEMEGL
jgi:hypothetical protein